MNLPTSDEAFEALCARLAAGDRVHEDEIPVQWRNSPRVQRLLQFARVVQGLAAGLQDEVAPPVSGVHSSVVDDGNNGPSQPQQVGQWQLVRLLGSGGMGQVWLGARQDDTAHQVAIKLVRSPSPAFATRLVLERQILARLSHPNIARFIDAGIHTDGAPWMALEYVEGATLNEWCETRPSLGQRLQIFLKVCAAVEHAHRHLVVHRDLKPGNIIVSADNEPRLLDFGIAKLLDASDSEFTAAALTPAYAAPEQLRGQTITTATDVYALGLLLFRLLAGALPSTREGVGLAQVLLQLDAEETQRASLTAKAHQGELPYDARLLQGDLDAIVSKAMRAAPEARFASVSALAADLQRYCDGMPVLARTPTFRYRCARFVVRNRVAVGLSTMAASALVLGTAVALWQAQLAQAAAQRAKEEATNAIQEAKTSERVTAFALNVLSQINPHGRNTAEIKSGAQLIAENIERAKRDLRDDPRAQSRILTKLAEIQSIVDTPARAEATLTYALGLATVTGEVQPRDQLTLRFTLATVLLQQKRYLEAEQVLLEILPRLAKDPALERYFALGYANLALIARSTDRIDLAIERLAKAYELAKLAYGAEHPNTIELLANRGHLLVQNERLEEAIVSFDSAILGFERHQGAVFPRLVSPLAIRATVHARIGQFSLARADCQRAMAIAATGFDPADSQLTRYRIACAQALLHAGDFSHTSSLLAASAGHVGAQPDVEFRIARGMAELHLLKHEFNLAQPHLTRAQLLQRAEPSLANESLKLTALNHLLMAGLGKDSEEEFAAAPDACPEDPLLCAARSLQMQRRGQSQAAFTAFTKAQQEIERRALDPAMFGAYQMLLARISSDDRQIQAARRWLDMAKASLSRATVDSDWRDLYATTLASVGQL